MVINAKDALIADLNSISLLREEKLKIERSNSYAIKEYRTKQNILLRNMMYDALYKIDKEYKDSVFLNYCKKMGNDVVEEELRSMIINGKSMLRIDDVLDKVTESVMNGYTKEPESFYEVMLRMIDYHTNMKDNLDEFNDKKSLKDKIITKLLSSLLLENKTNYFSCKNGCYQYVTKFMDDKALIRKKEIINEMFEYCRKNNLSYENLSINELINYYANLIADSYFEKKQHKSLDDNQKEEKSFDVLELINKAPLNDNQKKYLVDCCNKGDYEQLLMYRIIDEETYNKYFSKKDNEEKKDPINELIDLVKSASLNDNQKNYLRNCIDAGNYNELVNYGVINEDFLTSRGLTNHSIKK